MNRVLKVVTFHYADGSTYQFNSTFVGCDGVVGKIYDRPDTESCYVVTGVVRITVTSATIWPIS